MLYAPDFEATMTDRAEAAIDDMTAWLSGQPPNVWMWFAQRANPGTCMPILTWMIEQPTCDRAVVATIFWNCEPRNLAETLAAGEDRSVVWDEEELVELILLTWPEPPARDAGLQAQLDGKDVAYRAYLEARTTGDDPLSIPAWLFGPFGNTPCRATTADLLDHDEDLRNKMYALGMWYGVSPPEHSPDHPSAETGAPLTIIRKAPEGETPEDKRWRIGVGVGLIGFAVLMGWVLTLT